MTCAVKNAAGRAARVIAVLALRPDGSVGLWDLDRTAQVAVLEQEAKEHFTKCVACPIA